MARQLDIYLNDALVGVLEQDGSGRTRFRYADAWLGNPRRVALSQSLPLRAKVFNDRETRPFFAGLLPEAEKRDLVAKAFGVSKRNDFALLDRIGGECAGAQDKLPVWVVDGEVALPLHGAPSSHVMKPPIRRFEDTVANEGFCLQLAKAAGLHVVPAEIRKAKGTSYLLVERYDRRRDSAGALRRTHQEDCCQALGFAPEVKYQSEGGPSLKDCFALLRRAVARPVVDIARLLDAVIFNLLIGNNDAHGKNFSLLYGEEGTELAPLYDLTSTAVYPDLSPLLAMKIGGSYDFAELRWRHWDRFAKEAGLGPAQVRRRLIALARSLPEVARRVRGSFAAEGRPILDRIVATIDERSSRALGKLKGGVDGSPD